MGVLAEEIATGVPVALPVRVVADRWRSGRPRPTRPSLLPAVPHVARRLGGMNGADAVPAGRGDDQSVLRRARGDPCGMRRSAVLAARPGTYSSTAARGSYSQHGEDRLAWGYRSSPRRLLNHLGCHGGPAGQYLPAVPQGWRRLAVDAAGVTAPASNIRPATASSPAGSNDSWDAAVHVHRHRGVDVPPSNRRPPRRPSLCRDRRVPVRTVPTCSTSSSATIR